MPKRNPPTNNPYGRAAQNYSAQDKLEESARGTEARALLKAAKMLQELQVNWNTQPKNKIEETLKQNRQIWVIFYDSALKNIEDTSRAQPLSANVVSLANFVFKKSVEILAAPDPAKLNVLININREVAGGLMARHPVSGSK